MKKTTQKAKAAGVINQNAFNEKVDELYRRGFGFPEIRDEVMNLTKGLNSEQVYNRVKKRIYKVKDMTKTATNVSEAFNEDTNLKKSFSRNADGETTLDCVIALFDDEEITEEKVLEAYNMIPSEWVVQSFKVSLWQSPSGDEARTLWSCKLSARPTRQAELQDVMDNAVKLVTYDKAPLVKSSIRHSSKRTTSRKELEIAIPDLHYGLRANKKATGETYNRDIARERVLECIEQIAEECSDQAMDFVRIVTLGDFIHVDNGKQTTTNGTFQQLDGDIYEVTAGAIDLMVEIIELVRDRFNVPIEYLYIQGNHDRELGFMIAKAVEQGYKDIDDVTIDAGENPNKIRKYGNMVVGYTHGDMRVKQLNNLLQTQFRKEYAMSDHPNHRIHVGHLHNFNACTESDVVIKHFPTLCGSSLWEHQQGFDSPKAMCYTIFNIKTGNIQEGTVYPTE